MSQTSRTNSPWLDSPEAPRRLPWRFYLFLWAVRKFALRLAFNLRYRRPFWSAVTLTSLHRMIDMRRVPPTAIPVVINNFNRLDSLRTLVDWLQRIPGDKAIIILDNASTYPPLLDYYRALNAPNLQVVRLGYNSGLEGIQDAAKELRGFRRLVITDPDLIPYPGTPDDMLLRLDAMLDRYPRYTHIGASMEIRDIPAAYPLRDEVLAWEARYWPPRATRVGEDGFAAWVDTTFAMYRQGADVTKIEPAMRLDRPYTLRHVDWYVDPAAMTDEQRYYLAVSRPVASWTHRLRATERGTDDGGPRSDDGRRRSEDGRR